MAGMWVVDCPARGVTAGMLVVVTAERGDAAGMLVVVTAERGDAAGMLVVVTAERAAPTGELVVATVRETGGGVGCVGDIGGRAAGAVGVRTDCCAELGAGTVTAPRADGASSAGLCRLGSLLARASGLTVVAVCEAG
jgi:hypothetical protein